MTRQRRPAPAAALLLRPLLFSLRRLRSAEERDPAQPIGRRPDCWRQHHGAPPDRAVAGPQAQRRAATDPADDRELQQQRRAAAGVYASRSPATATSRRRCSAAARCRRARMARRSCRSTGSISGAPTTGGSGPRTAPTPGPSLTAQFELLPKPFIARAGADFSGQQRGRRLAPADAARPQRRTQRGRRQPGLRVPGLVEPGVHVA